MAEQTATRFGTIGGTLLGVFAAITGNELLKTVLLASTGAVVSFIVSIILKEIANKLGPRRSRRRYRK
jgi:uncharacterized membrane protein YeaQ/YmgE (transglycosylase-associated protein family)